MRTPLSRQRAKARLLSTIRSYSTFFKKVASVAMSSLAGTSAMRHGIHASTETRYVCSHRVAAPCHTPPAALAGAVCRTPEGFLMDQVESLAEVPLREMWPDGQGLHAVAG